MRSLSSSSTASGGQDSDASHPETDDFSSCTTQRMNEKIQDQVLKRIEKIETDVEMLRNAVGRMQEMNDVFQQLVVTKLEMVEHKLKRQASSMKKKKPLLSKEEAATVKEQRHQQPLISTNVRDALVTAKLIHPSEFQFV